MNVKDMGGDVWRLWPALMRRALPVLGQEEQQAIVAVSSSPSPWRSPPVQAVGPDQPGPWRYVRWQRANERQPFTVSTKAARPKGNYVYKVLPDEDLSGISFRHDTFIEVIAEANHILNPRNVATGQLLWIPRTHHIKKGNTLWSLSRKYGVSISTIQAANGIQDPDLIYAGDIIIIPDEP